MIIQGNTRRIRKLACELRKAIEEAGASHCFDNDIRMRNFPRGCCGEASDLMGEFLLDNRIDDLYYVCGTHYPDTGDDEADFQGRQSHAWISIGHPNNMNSLIVDITGDQFRHDLEYGYYDVKVYVGKMDKFHRLFEVDKACFHKFNGIKYYGDAKERLYRLYNEVIKRVNH